MARKTKIVVVCDRHRQDVEAVGSIEIVIDGERRRLDLCAEHLAELRKVVRPWLKVPAATAKPRASSRRKATPARRPTRSPDSAAVREWARASGYDLPAHGCIPNAVREAYAAAE